MSDGLYQITPPSAVILDERKYPVVTNDPTWSQICERRRALPPASRSRRGDGPRLAGAEQRSRDALHTPTITSLTPPAPGPPRPVGSFRTEDYKLLGTAVGVGAPWGYLIGTRAPAQRPRAGPGQIEPGAAPSPATAAPGARRASCRAAAAGSGGAAAAGRTPCGGCRALLDSSPPFPRPTAGYRYHLPRQSAWFGVFMFGTAALAHTTQRVAGGAPARAAGGWAGGAACPSRPGPEGRAAGAEGPFGRRAGGALSPRSSGPCRPAAASAVASQRAVWAQPLLLAGGPPPLDSSRNLPPFPLRPTPRSFSAPLPLPTTHPPARLLGILPNDPEVQAFGVERKGK
jgi:hypothetical protein